MPECCDPASYRRLFNSKEAGRRVSSYRRKGLGTLAAGIVEFLRVQGVSGMDVLEVGGGVGEMQIELLESGASSAVNIELSDSYEPFARDLATERGLVERMSRRTGDFVALADDIEPADIVLLNRVVCCYPFMAKMVNAAADKTNRFLGLVFPKDLAPNRAFVGLGNKWLALRRCDFRAYVHSVAEIESILTAVGLQPTYRDQTLVWRSAVWERAA